jgi:hypothetical protein
VQLDIDLAASSNDLDKYSSMAVRVVR